jgi:hypothetical protein
MNGSTDVVSQGLRAMAFLALLWLSLAAVFQVVQWEPDTVLMQAGRIVTLLFAGIIAAMSVFGATAGLMAMLGLGAPKDAAPKP